MLSVKLGRMTFRLTFQGRTVVKRESQAISADGRLSTLMMLRHLDCRQGVRQTMCILERLPKAQPFDR